MKKTSSVLGPIIKRLGIEDGVRLIRIQNDWHSIFDRPLSVHMSPSRLSEGELLLNVDSPIWIQQLTYHKNEILGKLTGYGVKSIRFRVGRIARRENKFVETGASVDQRHQKLSGEDETFISGLISQLTDSDIRDAVKRAAEKAVTRRHRVKKLN